MKNEKSRFVHGDQKTLQIVYYTDKYKLDNEQAKTKKPQVDDSVIKIIEELHQHLSFLLDVSFILCNSNHLEIPKDDVLNANKNLASIIFYITLRVINQKIEENKDSFRFHYGINYCNYGQQDPDYLDSYNLGLISENIKLNFQSGKYINIDDKSIKIALICLKAAGVIFPEEYLSDLGLKITAELRADVENLFQTENMGTSYYYILELFNLESEELDERNNVLSLCQIDHQAIFPENNFTRKGFMEMVRFKDIFEKINKLLILIVKKINESGYSKLNNIKVVLGGLDHLNHDLRLMDEKEIYYIGLFKDKLKILHNIITELTFDNIAKNTLKNSDSDSDSDSDKGKKEEFYKYCSQQYGELLNLVNNLENEFMELSPIQTHSYSVETSSIGCQTEAEDVMSERRALDCVIQ